jgi:hypothetical protein
MAHFAACPRHDNAIGVAKAISAGGIGRRFLRVGGRYKGLHGPLSFQSIWRSGTLHGAVVPLCSHSAHTIIAALGAGGMGEVYKAQTPGSIARPANPGARQNNPSKPGIPSLAFRAWHSELTLWCVLGTISSAFAGVCVLGRRSVLLGCTRGM